MSKLDTQIADLETLSKADLEHRWGKLIGRPTPKLSAAMLRLALAYELQAKGAGGLSRRARQRLDQVAGSKSETNRLSPGMRLAREFGGTLHVVTISEEGEICWNNRRWRSLSEVARAITGTRWSGPAFFGLRATRKAAA
jgi:hypothetical protein